MRIAIIILFQSRQCVGCLRAVSNKECIFFLRRYIRSKYRNIYGIHPVYTNWQNTCLSTKRAHSPLSAIM